MPTVLAASITRVCGGTLTARPSMVRLISSGMGPRLNRGMGRIAPWANRVQPTNSKGGNWWQYDAQTGYSHPIPKGGNWWQSPFCASYGHRAFTVLVRARSAVQMVLEFLPELLHDRDGRHGGGIAQGAERPAQHIPRDIADQVDIGARARPIVEASQNLLQPGGAFAARDAPAAAFMGVEAHDAQGGFHHAGVFVHDDDAAGAQHGFARCHGIVVHGSALHFRGGEHRATRPARNEGLQLLAVAYAAAYFLDHLLHREAEFELVDAGLVDVAGEAGHLGAAGFGNAERRKRRAAIAQDRRHGAESLHVVQDGGALERARHGGERRAYARDAALAFERFQ